jgi:hypothetical protein
MSPWRWRVAGGFGSIVAALILGWGTCAAGAGWVVTDRETAAGSCWYTEGRAIIHDSAAATSSADPGQPAGSMLVYNGRTWSDHAFGGRFLARGQGALGFIIRYRDNNNYYRVLLVSAGGAQRPVARIEKCVAGRLTTLAQADWGFVPGTWYTIGFGAVEDLLCVQISGELELMATDNAISVGKVGLVCSARPGARFEALNVTTDGRSTLVLPLKLEAPPAEAPPDGSGVLTFAPNANSILRE